MKRFIFGERSGIYIIDLEKSLVRLKDACSFLFDTVVRGRTVLFVGTKKQAHDVVKDVATRTQQHFVINRWLGGTLTNLTTIRKSISRMTELDKLETSGEMAKLPKKEVSRLRRELEKLHFNLDGIAKMDQIPGALIVIDTNREAIAVAEAKRLNIPVVAIVDTNSDPDPVQYPIPGNDDAIRSVQLVISVLGEAIEKATQEYSKVAADEARKRAADEAAAQARARAEVAVKAAAAAAEQQKARVERKARKAKEEADEAAAPAPEASADEAAAAPEPETPPAEKA
jgi:small subunit ribosomal protein S2